MNIVDYYQVLLSFPIFAKNNKHVKQILLS